MKKLMMMVVGAIAAMSAFAAEMNDVRVTFWTKGPDQYKDGSTVVDGEMYALVWTKAGATFGGFAADGSLVDGAASELIACGAWAKKGRCSYRLETIPAAQASKYASGTYTLVLLDTRNADGTVSAARTVDGKTVPAAVNGESTVASSSATGEGTSSTMNASGTIRIETVSALPPNAPTPEISGFEMVTVNGEQMLKLKVKKTAPYLRYDVAGGETPKANDKDHVASKGVNGAAKEDDEVELLVPAKGNKGFFKIIRQ